MSTDNLAKKVVNKLKKLDKSLSVAESITAGGIANSITQAGRAHLNQQQFWQVMLMVGPLR